MAVCLAHDTGNMSNLLFAHIRKTIIPWIFLQVDPSGKQNAEITECRKTVALIFLVYMNIYMCVFLYVYIFMHIFLVQLVLYLYM